MLRFNFINPFAPSSELLRHKKLLKSWTKGENCSALGARQFMKLTPGVNNSKLFASSKKKLGPLLKKQILYFQITVLPFNEPSSFFLKNPASLFFKTQNLTFTRVLTLSYKLVYIFCWLVASGLINDVESLFLGIFKGLNLSFLEF